MKVKNRILLTVIAGVFITSISIADTGTPARTTNTAKTSVSDNSSSLLPITKVSEIIGMDVKNHQNERLGEIKDVMVDLKGGHIVYMVLASGGFLGVGDKYLALPSSSLMRSSDSKHLVLNAEAESIRSAPGLDKNNWPLAANQNFKKYRESKSVETAEDRISKNRNADQLQGKRQYAKMRLPGPVIKEPSGAAGTQNETITNSESSGLAAKATQILGQIVKNPQNERLGDIKDLAVDLAMERVVYAVLSTGGFLGIGDKLFAVPSEAFKNASEPNTLLIKADKDTLSAAASFGKNNWPSEPDPAWRTQIYFYRGQEHSYGPGKQIVEPSGARPSGNADHTRRNAQDHDGKHLTASDQSGAKEDIALTRALRRAVVADPSLSILAKNIKIISINGKITLRGLVQNEAEKKQILNEALRIVGVDALDNQLEVKNKK